MIKVKGLRVDYAKVTAVNDVDIEVAGGQIYGLVGPNGAGKTSFLKAIAGMIEPTYGEIHINGVDMELHPREALKQIGFMPDVPSLYETLKVREYLNVFAAAYLIEVPRRNRIVQEWVERMNLHDKIDSYVNELSRGMRQRLILAKTLLPDPAVILLDEPASGLDPISRLEMRNILTEIAKAGKAIVISSHILPELSDYCNAIGIMEKGRMVVSGSLEEIRMQMNIRNELVIQLAKDDDATHAILFDLLKASPLVIEPRVTGKGEFICGFSGDKIQASEFLEYLVVNKLPIAQFILKEPDVEDIFFKIGAWEVS